MTATLDYHRIKLLGLIISRTVRPEHRNMILSQVIQGMIPSDGNHQLLEREEGEVEIFTGFPTASG